MPGPSKIYFIIFDLATIAGGVIGYLKAGSAISLISGSISGLLLLGAAFLLPGQAVAGLALGGIVSLLLIRYFLPAFFRTGKMMPAGMMSLLSILGLVFAIVGWIRR
ncbi:MAG: TMEM14 family protein [Chthoniobacterales bacterium]